MVLKMRHSIQVGFSFGLTSGIITTLGIIVGLNSGTHSQLAVIGGILTIAIADSLSDAMGIHISEESENKHTSKEVWESTFATFFFKLIVASSFIIPVLIFTLERAIIVSVAWGLVLLTIFSYKVAQICKKNVLHVVGEHLIIGVAVIIIANYVGVIISNVFS
jgi:VIT1/CCC1 family predicted Fe2+/Mn2+ transporter